MKILFITPHLSTGGGPQYLLKKIIELRDDHDVYCVEYSDVTGGVLVVQRNQIQSLLKEKLITLHEDKFELIKHIQNVNPDVIHFEELPEYFCDKLLAQQIYNPSRTYKIIETSHDSSFNPNNKCFFPDRFIFVSIYQKELFKSLNIQSDIVEYPIVYRKKSDRDLALKELNLDPRKTHFLNVGLFTSRKNQSEIIEYAKHLLNENIQFHFVGNQAENFKYYWEPLMKQFPSNCKWWGERRDVDTFYNAMDVFLFTSRGTASDKETSPLVIREAIGWDLPLLMYNLPVYCGMYNKYKNITWLEKDIDKNLDIIKSFIINKDPLPKELFDISFNEHDNKLDINYNGIDILNDVFVTVKDRDSKTCIFSIRWQFMHANVPHWIMPLPKHVCDFKNDVNFSGFLLQVFTKNKTEKIYEKEIILKNINIKKTVLEFSDEDPIFNNYNEFFVDKIYDDLNLKNLNICFDIGSNVGLFTKYLKLNNCNKIFCFEPNKTAFNSLQKNLKDESELELFNLAVSYNNESLRLYIDDNNSLISSAHDVKNNYYDVETITLKDIFERNKIQKVDFVKIDIEGMEFDLIENLEESIFKKIDKFLIEYHDFYFTDGIQKLEKLKSKLNRMGYNIVNKHRYIYATKSNQ
jgi:FkbM family methyltransferase